MDNLNMRGATLNVISAAWVAGTTKSITHTVASRHVINGKFASSLGALTNSATCPTTDAATGLAFTALTPNQCCVYVFGANAAGTVKLLQGSIEATDTGVTTTAGAFRKSPQFPNLPDDFCPMAYTVAVTAPSTTTWTIGTDNWASAGAVCTTFRNVSVLPDRPVVTA